MPQLAERVSASGVYWNRCYEPYVIARDQALKRVLAASGFDVASFNASLLFEPWQIKTCDCAPFKVYSAFWRACLKELAPRAASAPTLRVKILRDIGLKLADLALLPAGPNWAKGFEPVWQPGEAGARRKLTEFLTEGLSGYAELRNRPDLPNVSRLSPHIHFGEISPRQIWDAVMKHAEENPGTRLDSEKFLSEIGWREFAYHLLYHFPSLPQENWKPSFDAYPWQVNNEHLAAWKKR